MTDPRVPHDSPLSPRSAFVIHLAGDDAAASDALSGRVEHVKSGRSLRFASIDELVEFMRRTVATATRSTALLLCLLLGAALSPNRAQATCCKLAANRCAADAFTGLRCRLAGGSLLQNQHCTAQGCRADAAAPTRTPTRTATPTRTRTPMRTPTARTEPGCCILASAQCISARHAGECASLNGIWRTSALCRWLTCSAPRPTITAVSTYTSTATRPPASPTPTPSATTTAGATHTATATQSASPPATASATASRTATATHSASPTASATATASASQTATATAVSSATATATATLTATASASPSRSVTASATASDTPTATATATASETPTSSPTPTPAFCGTGDPIPAIEINPGRDDHEHIPVPGEVGAPGQCLAQTINQGGCRSLQFMDGSITNSIEAGDSVDPRACTVEQTALSYHWQIFWPPLFNSAQYASSGITGYHLPVLTIRPDSIPSLDDTISATDPYWRVSLTVVPLPREGEAMTPAPRTVWFRIHYFQTQLDVTTAANCNPVVTMSCPSEFINAHPPTEPY